MKTLSVLFALATAAAAWRFYDLNLRFGADWENALSDFRGGF